MIKNLMVLFLLGSCTHAVDNSLADMAQMAMKRDKGVDIEITPIETKK